MLGVDDFEEGGLAAFVGIHFASKDLTGVGQDDGFVFGESVESGAVVVVGFDDFGTCLLPNNVGLYVGLLGSELTGADVAAVEVGEGERNADAECVADEFGGWSFFVCRAVGRGVFG